MIKAILFDVGGVIYKHPRSPIPIIFSRIYRQPYADVFMVYRNLKRGLFTGKITADQFILTVGRKFDASIPVAEVKELWIKYYRKFAVPDRTVLRYVKKLRQLYRVYLFSNTVALSSDLNEKIGLFKYFDGRFLSFEMRMKKPDPAVYLAVLKHLNLSGDECVFVDDQEGNLRPAHKLGFRTVHFDLTVMEPEKLKEKLIKLKLLPKN